MSENTQKHSSFKNSLLYRVCLHVLSEVRSPENQWYAGEHFHNDPTEHPGERTIHYVRTGRAHKAINEFKDTHPELIRNIPDGKRFQYKESTSVGAASLAA